MGETLFFTTTSINLSIVMQSYLLVCKCSCAIFIGSNLTSALLLIAVVFYPCCMSTCVCAIWTVACDTR